MYQTTYQFVTKVLASQKPGALNFKGCKNFQVGRPNNARSIGIKRVLTLTAIVSYLLIGFVAWVLLKIFSKNRAQYAFSTVVFKWITIFKVFLDQLKT